jgi:hypothetical protein
MKCVCKDAKMRGCEDRVEVIVLYFLCAGVDVATVSAEDLCSLPSIFLIIHIDVHQSLHPIISSSYRRLFASSHRRLPQLPHLVGEAFDEAPVMGNGQHWP